MGEGDPEFCEWITDNEDDILTSYIEQVTDFPDEIYDGYLDDDYQDAEEKYLEEVVIDDVPDDFIRNMYRQP